MPYHCQDPHAPIGNTLCGVNSPEQGHAYDLAEYFFRDESLDEPDYNWQTRTAHKLVRCQECLDHPDVPLLLLGVL
jgi:hypothetical protein